MHYVDYIYNNSVKNISGGRIETLRYKSLKEFGGIRLWQMESLYNYENLLDSITITELGFLTYSL